MPPLKSKLENYETTMNIAIIIGVSKYNSPEFGDLAACHNDAKVFSDVIQSVKKLDDTLIFSQNEKSREIKNKICDFIDKHKNSQINELTFFFSGHGERDDDDFYYILSDYERNKKDSTGLKNSELDNWFKTLSPNLCIKIVDACYSGSQYIKSDANEKSSFDKSAKNQGLNNLYFMFSSRENKPSYAGSDFSKFTESYLTSLLDTNGLIRYNQIISYISDDLSKSGYNKPWFIIQADNTEKFGDITDETHRIIYDAFGLSINEMQNSNDLTVSIEETTDISSISTYTHILKKSETKCIDETRTVGLLESFNKQIVKNLEQFHEIYNIKESFVDVMMFSFIPNRRKIGIWLSKEENKSYFAKATYTTEKYETEEYGRPVDISQLEYIEQLSMSFMSGKRKLQKVIKERKVVDGFNYTKYIPNSILNVTLEPIAAILDQINIITIPIYSHKSIVIHFSYEIQNKISWDKYSDPICENWKTISLNIEDPEETFNQINNEIGTWIHSYLSQFSS